MALNLYCRPGTTWGGRGVDDVGFMEAAVGTVTGVECATYPMGTTGWVPSINMY